MKIKKLILITSLAVVSNAALAHSHHHGLPYNTVTIINTQNTALTFLSNQDHEAMDRCVTLRTGIDPVNSVTLNGGPFTIPLMVRSHYGGRCNGYAFTIQDTEGDICKYTIVGAQLGAVATTVKTKNLCNQMDVTSEGAIYTYKFGK